MKQSHRSSPQLLSSSPPASESDPTKSSQNIGSNAAMIASASTQGVAESTPTLDAIGQDGEPEKRSTSTGPLDAALSKRGQVTYVDPKYGIGNNKRKFVQDEVDLLTSGSEDMTIASCSPYTYWALENADNAANPNAEGSLLDRPLGGSTTIKEVVNCQSSAYEGVTDNDGNDADWEDLILGNVPEEDAWRGKGVAGALVEGDLGEEVEIKDAKPGDLCQSWRTWTKKGEFTFGGHSTQVHRVHALGGAWFGVDGAPLLESVEAGSEQLAQLVELGVCDESGSVQMQPTEPVFVERCTFRIDETTQAREIGAHTVLTQELIGAHNLGINADTGEEDSGVFTTQAEDLTAKHNNKDKVGAKRVYLARLNESQWLNWQPADAGTHIQKLDVHKIARIPVDLPDLQPMPVAQPVVPETSKRERRRGK